MKENVKVETSTLNRVRKLVKTTRQTVGGFYDLAAQEKLERETANKKISAKIKSSKKQ